MPHRIANGDRVARGKVGSKEVRDGFPTLPIESGAAWERDSLAAVKLYPFARPSARHLFLTEKKR